jgi:hypothetical protein
MMEDENFLLLFLIWEDIILVANSTCKEFIF